MKLTMIWIFALFVLVETAYGSPPQYYGISGYIIKNSGSQAPLGTNFRIINVQTSEEINSETNLPVPGYSGWYSEVLQGSDGNEIKIYAWNSTNYGFSNYSLAGDTEKNITLNLTRNPEINLSIISPQNNTEFNVYNNFKVNVSIDIIGNGTAKNCTFILSSTGSCLDFVSDSAEHNISSISSQIYETWNVRGICNDSVNILVNSSCDTDSINFDNKTSDTVYNITFINTGAPITKIISPGNNTKIINSSLVTFYYNVTDSDPIQNCSLFVNGTLLNYTLAPEVNVTLNLSSNINNGQKTWNIICYDSSNNPGDSGNFNLSMEVYYPSITSFSAPTIINLLAGSSKEIHCNGIANDDNGYSDIKTINATFYYSEGGYSSVDSDDNNSHYSTTCSMFNQVGTTTNFTCSFNLSYHAPPGAWGCNVSVYDISNHFNSSLDNSTINPLYAMDIPVELSYGVLNPTETSLDKSLSIRNVGNVPINISIKGYGITESDNLAMTCQQGNISISNEKYAKNSGVSFDLMNSIPNSFSLVQDFQIAKEIDTASYGYLYFKLYAESGIRGICNGSLILSITT